MKDSITITLIGNIYSGKTNLASRYAINKYKEDYSPTVKLDFQDCDFDFLGKKIKIKLWDSPGHERFRTITGNYIKDVDIITLVYSIDNRKSFEEVKRCWLPKMKEECRKDVGNKSDLSDWEVTEKEAEDFAKENGLYFGIVSAKTGDGVKNFFDSIIDISLLEDEDALIIEKLIRNLKDEKGLNYELSKEEEEKKIYCERCKSIPLITFSSQKNLNIDIKCKCDERKNVPIEEYFKSLSSIESIEINGNCHNHPDKKGIIFCSDCNKFLCDECLQQHNINHKLIKDKKIINNSEKYDYHKYRRAKYCLKNSKIKDEYICLICLNSLKEIIVFIKKPSKEKHTKQNDYKLFLNNIRNKNLDKAIKIVYKFRQKYEQTRREMYLKKILIVKNKFEKYKIKYPYLIKLYEIMFYMRNTYEIRNYNLEANLIYLRQFHLQSLKEKLDMFI